MTYDIVEKNIRKTRRKLNHTKNVVLPLSKFQLKEP